MLGLFSNVPKVFNVAHNLKKIQIDNFAAKCQYRLTTVMLVVFTIIVCGQNYIGQPIDCVQSSGSIPQNVLNTYCYFIGTYSVISNDTEYPFYGIAPGPETGPGTTRHLWYQWVPFYLTFLALTYYSAHFFWKALEKGTLKSVMIGMEYLKFAVADKKVGEVPSSKEREQQLTILAGLMYQRIKANVNRSWTGYMLLIEVYAMLQAAFAYYLTDVFLGGNGAFVRLTMQTAPEVFPTMTKCIFHKYGPSGSIQKHDALCVLAINIVNEKFFYILHIWFPFVLAMAVLAVLWRLLCFALFRNLKFNKVYYRENRNCKLDDDDREVVLQTISFWDWVFLAYVATNSSGIVFNELYSALADCIRNDSGSDDDSTSLLLRNEECKKAE